MTKILVVKSGEGIRRIQMIEELLIEAGHKIAYEMPEPKPLEIIFDEELVEKCGTKFVTEDEDGILTTYFYKGNFYITEYFRKGFQV